MDLIRRQPPLHRRPPNRVDPYAKHAGTVDPDHASTYTAALREADDGFLSPSVAAQQLLGVMFDLAEFAAARDAEPTQDLVSAFAQRLREGRS